MLNKILKKTFSRWVQNSFAQIVSHPLIYGSVSCVGMYHNLNLHVYGFFSANACGKMDNYNNFLEKIIYPPPPPLPSRKYKWFLENNKWTSGK